MRRHNSVGKASRNKSLHYFLILLLQMYATLTYRNKLFKLLTSFLVGCVFLQCCLIYPIQKYVLNAQQFTNEIFGYSHCNMQKR